MSVHEIRSLFNQEHEIFYFISNLIISSIYLEKYNVFIKGNVNNYLFLFITFKFSSILVETISHIPKFLSLLLHIKSSPIKISTILCISYGL